jgi:Skp family chaperone for outer membrane proteins
MRSLRLIITGLLFTFVFSFAAFAQTTAPTGKIGLIDTRFFDNGKDGIAKYSAAMDSVIKEFEVENNAMKTMLTKLQTLEKEIATLREQLNKPNSPVKPETLYAKSEEYDKLTREFKFKQEDGKVRFQRREQVVMTPIRRDISKAMDEFAKQKGFALILDVSKIADAGLILAMDEKVNLTQDFIKFYNARPATAATTATK